MSSNFSESVYKDSFYAEDWEQLPCDYTINYHNIGLFFEGKPYIWYDNKGLKIEQNYDDSFIAAYNYYYNVWKLSKKFGLPNGKGWLYEFSWLPDFIDFFDMVFDSITEYRRSRNSG